MIKELPKPSTSTDTVIATLHRLPSNKARELALLRLLQKGLKAEVTAVARALEMKRIPEVWSLPHLIALARVIQSKGGQR